MPFKPFFPPSSKITRKLMHRIGKRRANTIREASAEPTSPESSDELLGSILAALETDTDTGAEADWEDQRWLSEVLYHFMGLRAGRVRRGAEIEKITHNEIVEGMRNGLGLYQDQDRPLLEELADDFSSWLTKQNNSYVAGWGTIVRDPNDSNSFRLSPLPKHSSEPLMQCPDRISDDLAKAAQRVFR